MSILRKGDTLPIGTLVRSIAVGSKEEFEGFITGYCREGYHVEDSSGKGWVRRRDEFKILADAESR